MESGGKTEAWQQLGVMEKEEGKEGRGGEGELGRDGAQQGRKEDGAEWGTTARVRKDGGVDGGGGERGVAAKSWRDAGDGYLYTIFQPPKSSQTNFHGKVKETGIKKLTTIPPPFKTNLHTQRRQPGDNRGCWDDMWTGVAAVHPQSKERNILPL